MEAAWFSWMALSLPHLLNSRSEAAGGASGYSGRQRGLGLPLLVSLSLIRKEPTLLTGARSCLSASLRQIDLKNHLEKKMRREADLRAWPRPYPPREIKLCSCCHPNPYLLLHEMPLSPFPCSL